MTTMHAPEQDLQAYVLGVVSEMPRPFDELLGKVLAQFAVDREEVVAAVWDLVEDEGLVYDASATFRRA
ncbi:hypothetical protein [Nocardioides ganghwensis]|uniref:Uncharacterized protein n=1 Tax=Nocardioides ganghwensis TaxID=252230 RepID=A0A4Q2S5D0_9ACTN|nr:hypothetical protein [Nocardioides ganghwensis]MBD3948153.1 hypothetical protein [Nocardioides ganghwensis]RYB96906.1 hypothetical protein EUA07_20960 [Nocardioides ganghwensis]